MRLEGRERWSLVLPYAAVLTLLIWAVFDWAIGVPWPRTWLGDWVPLLARWVPSV